MSLTKIIMMKYSYQIILYKYNLQKTHRTNLIMLYVDKVNYTTDRITDIHGSTVL